MDKNIELIKALYMTPNMYQIWAWGLTVMVVLFLAKPTRRFGGIGFGVGLVCMLIYMGLMGTMKDFAPKEYTKEQLQTKKESRAARPW